MTNVRMWSRSRYAITTQLTEVNHNIYDSSLDVQILCYHKHDSLSLAPFLSYHANHVCDNICKICTSKLKSYANLVIDFSLYGQLFRLYCYCKINISLKI